MDKNLLIKVLNDIEWHANALGFRNTTIMHDLEHLRDKIKKKSNKEIKKDKDHLLKPIKGISNYLYNVVKENQSDYEPPPKKP